MAAYDPSEWTDLFVAVAGAGAALAGLVFVAVSINIDRILALPGIPERALVAMLTLVVVVIVAIAGLIPGQSTTALGIEILIVAIAFSAWICVLWPKMRPGAGDPLRWTVARIGVYALAAVPLLVGSLTLLAEAGGGLYWIVGGIVGAIFGAVANAWVLLVEILR